MFGKSPYGLCSSNDYIPEEMPEFGVKKKVIMMGSEW